MTKLRRMYNYKKLGNTYKDNLVENYIEDFVRSSVLGSIQDRTEGTRAGLASIGPVKVDAKGEYTQEPSPINSIYYESIPYPDLDTII